MHNEIDLSKFNLRTDLIIESNSERVIKEIKRKKTKDIYVYETLVNEKNKNTKYITISFKDITDKDNFNDVKNVFKKEFNKFLNYLNILDNFKCLIIGLGNINSTPDSLGPKLIDNILVTKHLFELDDVNILNDYRNVAFFSPGVKGVTGIESFDVIKGLIKEIKPDFLIVVDSLASSSIERVNKTIQITDKGLSPGSFLGSNYKTLSMETLKIPVIAIGVPTVLDAATIVSNTLFFLLKKIGYVKDKNTSKFYLDDKPINLSSSERKKVLGLVGNLKNEEVKKLMYEVLTPIGYNLMVTPKEIDFVIDKLTLLIGSGLNESLHKNIKTL